MRFGSGALVLAISAFGSRASAQPAPTEAARDVTATDSDTASPPPRRASEAAFGAHWFWVEGKAMPGVTLRAGRGLWWAAFETSLIWLTQPDPNHSSFLGSQLGGFVLVNPVRTSRIELMAGLGVDAFPLWNIHGDEWQVAMAVRASGHFRISSNFGVFATARAYPLSTRGLELGVRRDHSTAWPVLFGTGVEWHL